MPGFQDLPRGRGDREPRPNALNAPELEGENGRQLARARLAYAEACQEFENSRSEIPRYQQALINEAAYSGAEQAEVEAGDDALVRTLEEDFAAVRGGPGAQTFEQFVEFLAKTDSIPSADKRKIAGYRRRQKFFALVCETLALPYEENRRAPLWLQNIYLKELSYLNYIQTKTSLLSVGALARQFMQKLRNDYPGFFAENDDAAQNNIAASWLVDALIIRDRAELLREFIRLNPGDQAARSELATLEKLMTDPTTKTEVIQELRAVIEREGLRAAHELFGLRLEQEAAEETPGGPGKPASIPSLFSRRKAPQTAAQPKGGDRPPKEALAPVDRTQKLREELQRQMKWQRIRRIARKLGLPLALAGSIVVGEEGIRGHIKENRQREVIAEILKKPPRQVEFGRVRSRPSSKTEAKAAVTAKFGEEPKDAEAARFWNNLVTREADRRDYLLDIEELHKILSERETELTELLDTAPDTAIESIVGEIEWVRRDVNKMIAEREEYLRQLTPSISETEQHLADRLAELKVKSGEEKK